MGKGRREMRNRGKGIEGKVDNKERSGRRGGREEKTEKGKDQDKK